MKLKNVVLLDTVFIDALRSFSVQQIPITLTYLLNKCLKIMQERLEEINKVRNDLVRKYGKLSEDGKQINVTEENQVLFQSEISEFLNLEFELPIENKLVLSLQRSPNVDLSVVYMEKLNLLVEFKE